MGPSIGAGWFSPAAPEPHINWAARAVNAKRPDTLKTGTGRLAILAGGGPLPFYLRDHLSGSRSSSLVFGFKDYADPALEPDFWVDLAKPSALLQLLRDQDIDQLVLVGPVQRPPMSALLRDPLSLKILGAGLRALQGGDGRLLRAVADFLEREGFALLPIQDFLPDLMVKAGDQGIIQPTADDQQDIEFGRQALAVLSDLDVGQAIAVERGRILAIEGPEGTDAMIRRAGELASRDNTHHEGGGPVLIKAPKLGQDERVDLPTVGIETGRSLIKAGFRGMALPAGHCLVSQADRLVPLLDEARLFFTAFKSNE